MGLIAEEEDPEKGIFPLYVRKRSGTKGKGKADGGDGDDEEYTLPSASTVDMHIKALVHLYNQQCMDVENTAMRKDVVPSPRTYLSKLLKAYKTRLSRTKRAKDIGTVALVDTNSATSLRQMMKACWLWNYPIPGQVNRRRKMIGLRDRLDICWLQFMMSRGENLRKATLPDIFAHEVMRQGQGQFTLSVVLLMLQGKTNKDNRFDSGVVVRNKDVAICPVGSLALYLLAYWSVCRSMLLFSRLHYSLLCWVITDI